MEINIKNAFRIFVQISCKPLVTPYQTLSYKLGRYTSDFTKMLLKKPFLALSFFTPLMLLLLLLLSFSFFILILVSFGVVCIIFLEGFAITFAVILVICICFSCLPISLVVIYLSQMQYTPVD